MGGRAGGEHSDVQVHFVLRHGQYIFSHSLDTLHVLKRVARRLCRSGQPPSLHIKTCADKNRSSGRQASPTHPSILPIRASPSACLAQRHADRGAEVETITFFFSPPPLSFLSHEYAAPGATWHDEGNKWLLPEGTTFFKLLHQFFPVLFFLIIILHNTHLSVSRRFLFHCDAKRKSPCHYVN